MALGGLKLLLLRVGAEKLQKTVTGCSVLCSIAAVLYLALARESYAVMAAFLLLLVKGILLFRCLKGKN